MTVSEMIQKLSAYPPHFELKVFMDGFAESHDYTAEIIGVSNEPHTKIIGIEIGELTLEN